MSGNRLFLLDAYALIYRAYYALMRNPRITSDGLNTSAIFGFCNTLDEILRKEDPSHIAVCFDPSGPTFRHEEYAEYKAGRDKQPEDITLAVPYIKDIIRAWNIAVIERPGFEADDVIGTLSRMAEAEGYTTYMMTPDKDYGQLVTDHVMMYRPALRGEGFEVRGPKEVCERYGIDSPRQVIDLLALEGDASDNIPGCPGVGEKTAAKLIREFGSVENLLDRTAELKGALKTKVEANADQIRFSKYLATIRTDVPMEGVTIADLERKPADIDRLVEIYTRLEFRTFIRRLKGDSADSSSESRNGRGHKATVHRRDEATAAPVQVPLSLFDIPEEAAFQSSPKTDIATEAPDYVLLESVQEVAEMVAEASKHDSVAVWMDAVGPYGESEGKDGKGIFPASVDFTTDLHSMGQWIQDGERTIFETVLSVKEPAITRRIPEDAANLDGINYLSGKRIDEVNKMAELGTKIAHVDGGVPNIKIELNKLDEHTLGQLIYFFEKACGISGYMLGVNPFNQPGVEAYKKNMFALLEKPGYEKETEAIKAKLN